MYPLSILFPGQDLYVAFVIFAVLDKKIPNFLKAHYHWASTAPTNLLSVMLFEAGEQL